MKVFLVFGYLHSNFEIYGVFTTFVNAEDCVLSLQNDYHDMFCYIEEFVLDEMP